VLRNVDSNIDRVHLNPSLRKRARIAAQATVRVRWNDGRSTVLRNGLASPRMTRSSVRHRTGNDSRFGDSHLTSDEGDVGVSVAQELDELLAHGADEPAAMALLEFYRIGKPAQRITQGFDREADQDLAIGGAIIMHEHAVALLPNF